MMLTNNYRYRMGINAIAYHFLNKEFLAEPRFENLHDKIQTKLGDYWNLHDTFKDKYNEYSKRKHL